MSFFKKLFGGSEPQPKKENPIWLEYLSNKQPEKLKYFADMLHANRTLRSDMTRTASIPIYMLLEGRGVVVKGKEQELMDRVDIAVAVYDKQNFPTLETQENFKTFVEEFASTITTL